MNAYELISEEIQDRYSAGYITIEQACELNDLAYDKYVCEGANTDIIKKYRDKINEYKEEKKKIKKYIKAGDRNNLAKSLNKAEDILNDTKKELDKIDSSTVENMSAAVFAPLNNALTTNLYGDMVSDISSAAAIALTATALGVSSAYLKNHGQNGEVINKGVDIEKEDRKVQLAQDTCRLISTKLTKDATAAALGALTLNAVRKTSQGREGGNTLKAKCIKSINMEIGHIHYLQNKFDL